jgi:ABC-type dipeptide/oligopeptide/nickel transport system ATPase component
VTESVLRVEDLQAHFFTPEGVVKAVNGVSLNGLVTLSAE